MLGESLSDERVEPLNDFPRKLKLSPLLLLPLLLLLPNERVERSVVGTWIDWLLRPLKLRDESPPAEERDCPNELLDDMLRDDDPLLPLFPLLLDERPPWSRSFLSSLSRAVAKLAVRKTDNRPAVARYLSTRTRRIWGTFLSGRLHQSPTLL